MEENNKNLVLYIPLDERPCNYKFPYMHSKGNQAFDLLIPELNILSQKKKPANVNNLWDFIFKNIEDCSGIVFSVEMLVYGGLLPSRLHHSNVEDLTKFVNNIRILKQKKPQLIIYASNLIMRTPQYNSSEEEPDYYADFGFRIFTYGKLMDKQNRFSLTEEEQSELDIIKAELPHEIISDYSNRREINKAVTFEILKLVEDKIIDFLVIPQDDAYPFGFTAIDQKQIRNEIEKKSLEDAVYCYPGADEAGCTLVSRMFNILSNAKPFVFPYYSSTLGSTMIPKYEDRPFAESLKSHVLAQGGCIADSPHEADYILMINIPGKTYEEAWNQDIRDITYETYRNNNEFIERLKRYICKGYKCIICDVAFLNGGDKALVERLARNKLLNKIYGYAGWNTACNTLGSVLNMAFMQEALSDNLLKNIVYRLLEDYGYQSIVRKKTIDEFLPTVGASYYKFNGKDFEIHSYIKNQLQEIWSTKLKQSFAFDIKINEVNMPWKRMFEVDFELEI